MPRKTSHGSAEEFFPDKLTLPSLKDAAADCKACDLWKRGTQTVFGEGRKGSTVVFVGEQPGNEEDLTGKPFVGPAGRLFDNALVEAGIDRSQTYVTNVVKHFKWEPRGKRRIHKKPNAGEISACRPWLEAEIAVVKPKVIVALGATAARHCSVQNFASPNSVASSSNPPSLLTSWPPYIPLRFFVRLMMKAAAWNTAALSTISKNSPEF
jgi:uracil-DNA glycosylase family protein